MSAVAAAPPIAYIRGRRTILVTIESKKIHKKQPKIEQLQEPLHELTQEHAEAAVGGRKKRKPRFDAVIYTEFVDLKIPQKDM